MGGAALPSFIRLFPLCLSRRPRIVPRVPSCVAVYRDAHPRGESVAPLRRRRPHRRNPRNALPVNTRAPFFVPACLFLCLFVVAICCDLCSRRLFAALAE